MRVAIVSGEFPPDIGGTATRAATLLEGLTSRGHEVQVVSLHDGSKRLSEPGMVRYPRAWPWPVRLSATAWWLVRHRKNYDAVYSTSLHVAAVAGARLARRPIVIDLPGDHAWERARRLGLTRASFQEFQATRSGGPRVRAMRGLRSWSVRHASRVIVPSVHLQEAARRWADGAVDVNVVPIAADATPPHGRSSPDADRPGVLGVLFVGRLIDIKGVDKLVRAVASIEGVSLDIVGDGPERDGLERLADDLQVGDRVTFVGGLGHADVLERMRSADALVLASEQESLPTVVVEALASGLPVIAPAVGGLPEIIVDGENGLLVDRPEPGLIAGALVRLRDDSVLRRNLAEGAQRASEAWGVDAFVDAVEIRLDALVSRTRPRPRAEPGVGRLPRTLVLLYPNAPPLTKDAIFHRLRHMALDWARDDDWTIEFWGIRTEKKTGADGVLTRGPRSLVRRLPESAAIALSAISQFFLALRRPRPGVVVAQIPLFGAGFALAQTLTRRRGSLVVRVVGRTSTNAAYVRPSRLRYWFIETVERFVLRRAELVLAAGDFTRRFAESAGVAPERILVVPALVGTAEGFPEPEASLDVSSPSILCAARFVPEKGIDVLLRAFAKVCRDFPSLTLELAGDGDERPALERLAGELGVSERVRWRGFLPIAEMPGFYRAGSITVLSSRCEEGLGRSLIEGGLSGCALVATDLGGTYEIVVPGRTGLLVPPDDPDALADALRSLLDDPEWTRTLGKAAREVALSIYALKEKNLTTARTIFNELAVDDLDTSP